MAAGVPTIWMGVLSWTAATPAASAASSAAAPAVPKALSEAYREATGLPILQAWGMTETSPVGSATSSRRSTTSTRRPRRPPHERRPARRRGRGAHQPRRRDRRRRPAVGRRAPQASCRSGPVDRRRLLRRPPVGRLVHRRRVAQDRRRRHHRPPRVHPPGRPGQGRHQVGRRVDQLGRAENELMAHPQVAEAAVGVPDDRWGERPIACVVPPGRPRPVTARPPTCSPTSSPGAPVVAPRRRRVPRLPSPRRRSASSRRRTCGSSSPERAPARGGTRVTTVRRRRGRRPTPGRAVRPRRPAGPRRQPLRRPHPPPGRRGRPAARPGGVRAGRPGRRRWPQTRRLVDVALGRSELEPARSDKRFTDRAWVDNPVYRRVLQAYLVQRRAVPAGRRRRPRRQEPRAGALQCRWSPRRRPPPTRCSAIPGAGQGVAGAGPEPRRRAAAPATTSDTTAACRRWSTPGRSRSAGTSP